MTGGNSNRSCRRPNLRTPVVGSKPSASVTKRNYLFCDKFPALKPNAPAHPHTALPHPPRPRSPPRPRKKVWVQLGTKRVRLRALFCAMPSLRQKNRTRIIAFIYGLIVHVRAQQRSTRPWLRIPPLPPLFWALYLIVPQPV